MVTKKKKVAVAKARKQTKKTAKSGPRACPKQTPASTPPAAEYTSISQKEFIDQYLNGEIAESTLRRWMNKSLIAVDGRERPHRVFIDHPITKKFLKQRDEDESEKAALLTQKITDLTLGDIQDLSSAVIERIKTITDIQKVKIKNDAMTGVLIPRRLVKQCYDQYIAIDNSILKTLGSALSRKIAAIFESTNSGKILNAQKLIDNEVRKALKTKQAKYIAWLEKLDKND